MQQKGFYYRLVSIHIFLVLLTSIPLLIAPSLYKSTFTTDLEKAKKNEIRAIIDNLHSAHIDEAIIRIQMLPKKESSWQHIYALFLPVLEKENKENEFVKIHNYIDQNELIELIKKEKGKVAATDLGIEQLVSRGLTMLFSLEYPKHGGLDLYLSYLNDRIIPQPIDIITKKLRLTNTVFNVLGIEYYKSNVSYSEASLLSAGSDNSQAHATFIYSPGNNNFIFSEPPFTINKTMKPFLNDKGNGERWIGVYDWKGSLWKGRVLDPVWTPDRKELAGHVWMSKQ